MTRTTAPNSPSVAMGRLDAAGEAYSIRRITMTSGITYLNLDVLSHDPQWLLVLAPIGEPHDEIEPFWINMAFVAMIWIAEH